MAGMTGQIEQAQYRLRQLEDGFAAYRKTTDARLAAGSVAAPSAIPTTLGDEITAPAAPAAAKPGPAAVTPKPATPTGGATRAQTVAQVEKPTTGDAAEDAYLYGYRLWDAKLYPEAEAQLKKTVADHPKSRRASYAQNLLGRAYLDEGKPSLASIAFYDNYKKMPDGERAADSLYYLGQSTDEAEQAGRCVQGLCGIDRGLWCDDVRHDEGRRRDRADHREMFVTM